MFIILTVILILTVIYFWNNILTLLKILKTGNLDSTTGYIWFFTLLIINIIIITFIYGFYYYKTNQTGKDGSNGINGFPGEQGEPGLLKIPCYSQNKQNTDNN